MNGGSRRETIPFDLFVKRSWPLFVIAAIFLLFTSALLFRFAFLGKGGVARSAPAPSVTHAASTSTNEIRVPRALDGVLVAPEESHVLPYAVMIDNHADARPSSGLAEANLVYEIPVEGGLTRYMAIYDERSTAEQIGPVRSARPYFLDFADAIGAVYAHVGGSPEALARLSTRLRSRNIDEFFNGSSFWHSQKGFPPHNTYTRTDLLHARAAAHGWKANQWHAWRFKDDDPKESASGTSRGTASGPSIAYGGTANVAWEYDSRTNAYLRTLAQQPHIERHGARVTARNVVVILTDADILDAEGRLKLRTTGRGKAFLYRDGKRARLTWRRVGGEHIQFESVDGSEALFNRGTTWIEVVTNARIFEKIDS